MATKAAAVPALVPGAVSGLASRDIDKIFGKGHSSLKMNQVGGFISDSTKQNKSTD